MVFRVEILDLTVYTLYINGDFKNLLVFSLSLFSCVLRDSTPRYVDPSVRRSPFFLFYVFAVFGPNAPAKMFYSIVL